MSDRPNGRPCRACVDFKSWLKMGPKRAEAAAAPPVDPEHKPSDCPLDKDELGRNTWGFLHTMAANFPEKPSDTQKTEMSTFLSLFSKFYPCDFCARDMRKNMETSPPDTSNQSGLAQWLCKLHNGVNRKLGKPAFDCSTVDERWRVGWKDGTCG